jgi:hypothetical protein
MCDVLLCVSSSPPKLVIYVICPVFTGDADRDRDLEEDFLYGLYSGLSLAA